MPDGSCSLTSEGDCAAFGGSFGFTGTIYGTDGGCSDMDGDGISDPCDNCPDDVNPGQEDCDADGEGDDCEADDADDDDDGDGLCNGVDNCPWNVNPNQDDANGDGVGDACVLCLGSDGDAPGAGSKATKKDVFGTLAREAMGAVLLGRRRARPLLRATRRKDGDQKRDDKDAEV